jgi:membrane peptidoglycan carboxypeptidase
LQIRYLKYARMTAVSETPRALQVLQIIHKRRERRAATRRSAPQQALRAGGWLLAFVSVAVALAAVTALPIYSYVTAGLPDVTRLETMLDDESGTLLRPTQFYDRTGQVLLFNLEPANAPRKFIEAGDSPLLSAALVASSDPNFWTHSGTIWSRAEPGAYTLAERLVANLLLAGEPEGWPKTLLARVLAADATAKYGRTQILSWTINSTRFGHFTVGAESAAQFYFGKPASQLSLAEAAMLAATAQNPELNPIDAPEVAQQLGHLVVIAMHEQVRISDNDFNLAINEQIVVNGQPAGELNEFGKLAVSQAEEALGAERVELGGLVIITTLDAELQQGLEELVPEGSAVVLDSFNGRVLAMTGSQDPHASGSLLLPFIYLDAFANGQAPASLTWNLGQQASAMQGLQGPVSMRQALANGLSLPAADTLQELGAIHVARVLEAAGMSQFNQQHSEAEDTDLIMGAAQVNPVEAASAYGTLSNFGVLAGRSVGDQIRASTILFISEPNGDVILDWSVPEQRSVASAELAFLVTDSLSDVSARPEAQRVLLSALGRSAALQPGRLEDWAVGFSPQRVVVVNSVENLTETWAQTFALAHRDLPIQNWQAPGGLSSVMVCVPSGSLPSGDCPETRREYFPSGNEPRFADELYIRLAVNSLNGKLATVFTAEEFLQERLFLNVPADLQDLARAAGLELAPEDYDAIPALAEDATVRITTPARFGEVAGIITIRGQVSGEIVGWDLQAGPGLYPANWEQIAAGATQSVSASWDTSELSGLWALQLQAWDADGNVHRAFTIVTSGN